ncbi:MAG: HAD-IC family P-type ATPase, partial [Lachnospiraceae bacterium]|nr:HAD-IC family P-type ATPase [Lachnospiraceae bacterium]
FDKTGTLTKGVFKVNDIVSEGISKDRLLEIAAYAEAFSNHPIAQSITGCYEERGHSVDKALIQDIKEISGKGLVLTIEEGQYYVGNLKLLREYGIDTSHGKAEVIMQRSAASIGTLVYVADTDKLLGYITISDEIKEGAVEAFAALKSQGVKNTVMLTGDRKAVAEAVAGEFGIDMVYSELLPGDKLTMLEKIITSDKGDASSENVTIFVGDGINDAPSLTRADVGIAMGALGQDAAIEAADIVLMDDKPEKIALVQRIGRKTVSIVKENIAFALAVKLVIMVLGVCGIANMWMAVFGDVGVSVIAILNSMRMLRYNENR